MKPETLSSYFAVAKALAQAAEHGGRHSEQPQPEQLPRQPANSPWSCDPVPPEPPLGYSVDALPDLTKVSP